MFVKRLIPNWIKDSLKETIRERRFRSVMQTLWQLPPGKVPDQSLLRRLRMAWSNEGYSADLDYLQEVAKRAAEVSGSVLECGSGLTTLVLGLIAGRRGIDIWTLEHNPEWHARIDRVLRQHDIPRVRLTLNPLRSYGEYAWYDPPMNEMPREFHLVVCDGPPGTTRGGRYGLLPVIGRHLRQGAIVLLDDTERMSEIDALDRWKREYDMNVVVHRNNGKSFAIASRQ